MTLEQSKRDIVKEMNATITILKEVPFYTSPAEKVLALEGAKSSIKHVKTVEDLKKFKDDLLSISNEYGKKAKTLTAEDEKQYYEGLRIGYRMAHIIVRTELENMGLSGKKVSTPKKKISKTAGKK